MNNKNIDFNLIVNGNNIKEFDDFKNVLLKSKIQEGLIDTDKTKFQWKDIADFENKITERCKSDKPEIIDSILSSGKLEENSEKSLIEVITNLKKNLKS